MIRFRKKVRISSDAKNQLKEAIEDATKAIEKDITLAEAYVSRGIAKFLSKDENAAQEDFEYSKKLGYDPIEIQNKLNSIINNLKFENDE